MSIDSYLIKAGHDSEEDVNANQYKFEDSAKRGEEVNTSLRQQMIGTLLNDAKLYEGEPITNCTKQVDSPVSCEIADGNLKALNKIYPIQKSVWPHIFNKKSAILMGNTDYYPHLLYLPVICDMIKVILPLLPSCILGHSHTKHLKFLFWNRLLIIVV